MTGEEKAWSEAEVADLLRQAADYVDEKVRALTNELALLQEQIEEVYCAHYEVVAAYEEQIQQLVEEAV